MLIFRVVEEKRGNSCQNGDAALAFQVVRIHHALNEGLVGAENPALP